MDLIPEYDPQSGPTENNGYSDSMSIDRHDQRHPACPDYAGNLRRSTMHLKCFSIEVFTGK